ncbi:MULTISPECIES: hypothetical protein [Bifidobacterium]|uniref:hypothetical protein n=1 Tax=Bifidobacterium TaxID=1678 RepID=UPI001C3951CC|nr:MULTISPECIES: hypothetical protein [Bifidobacterium]MBV3807247.1 hypothetical protein [Bifidobacterium adolescentis]MBV3836137.1 hypothetical protein [Bifidobacterium sp. MSK.17.10]MCG4567306.1 hypothetical protein [Bifidobacterium adolescentis]
MYSKISEDTYQKLIDKLVRIPYVTGAYATRTIFGDGIEVAFQHRYMGKQVEYYLVASSQRDGRLSYRWSGGVYTVPSAHWTFDDGEYTPVELEEHKLESLDVNGLYDAIVSDLNKAMREL